VLSTPPAFVLSQNQTLQTKPKKANQRNPIKQDTKNWHQKNHTPKREKEAWQNNNKQKPPNTLLSSQTTHPL
jgi:hypothetical protein